MEGEDDAVERPGVGGCEPGDGEDGARDQEGEDAKLDDVAEVFTQASEEIHAWGPVARDGGAEDEDIEQASSDPCHG